MLDLHKKIEKHIRFFFLRKTFLKRRVCFFKLRLRGYYIKDSPFTFVNKQ